MRKFLFFALAFFSLLPAAAQSYYITETQLQKLETICQTYKISNQKLQSQVNELQQTVQKLNTDCETLKTNLKNERTTTQTLSESLKQYEISSSQSEAEKMQLLQDLADQKLATQKARTTIVILISVITFLVLAGAVGAYLLIKLK